MTARAGGERRGRGDGALDDGRKQAEASHVSNHDDKGQIVRLHSLGSLPGRQLDDQKNQHNKRTIRSVRQDAPTC